MDLKHWLIGLFAAIVNGAASGIVLMIADPSAFNLEQWPKLLTVSGLLGLLSAANYLKQSPVPPSWLKEVGKVSLLLVLAVALFAGGCAARGDRPHGRADVVNDAVYTALAALQDQEASDRALGLVPDDVHREFNRALVPALATGKALNTALAVWVPGTPLPRDVRTITEQVAALTRIVASTLPDENPAKARLLIYTNATQAAVLAFLDSLATTPGGLS